MKDLTNRLEAAMDIEYRAIMEILKDQNQELQMELVDGETKLHQSLQHSNIEFVADYLLDLKLNLHMMISESQLTLMNVQHLQAEASKKNVDWIFQTFLPIIEEYMEALRLAA